MLVRIIKKTKDVTNTLKNTVYDYFHRVETVMQQGNQLVVDVKTLLDIDNGYGDWLIHPCVRYIENGFAGHKWWMVCTPYPNYDSRFENPVLYYGDGNNDEPPEKWVFVKLVQQPYEKGYNADSNLFYDGERLWISWKEANTPNTDAIHGFKSIMAASFDGSKFSDPIKLLDNPDDTNMYLASQSLCVINNTSKLLAVFTPNSYLPIPNSQKGPRHLAVFGTDDTVRSGGFYFEGVFKQSYPEGFDFWHIDTFDYKNKYYCLVTPEVANQVLLGVSDDGYHYKFFEKPLLHYNGKEKSPYTYKVSGVIVNDMFYLFYPMKIDKHTVRLHVTKHNFEQLLNKLY